MSSAKRVLPGTEALSLIGVPLTVWLMACRLMATSGVVGRVVKVAAKQCQGVAADGSCQLDCGHDSTLPGKRGLKGKGGGSCSLEFTVREDDVKVGDIVTTSGIGGVFQKGIPLGEVTMVRKGEYGMFQTIDVRPAVNTYHLEEVLVLLQSDSTLKNVRLACYYPILLLLLSVSHDGSL